MFGSDPFAGTITDRPIGITSGGGSPWRPTRGCRARVNWPGGSLPITRRTSWPSSRSAAACSSACSTTAPQKDHENGTTMPTFISARVYARPAQCTDAARRCPPRDADHRGCAAQRRLLHAGAGAPARQEDGQPGRPDRLPPLLCRREGQRRRRHHLLRVPRCRPRQGRPGDGAHDRLAGRFRSRARLLGGAPGGRGGERDARGRQPRLRGSRGRPARAPRCRDDRRAARGEEPGDPGGVRPPGLRRRPRVRDRPRAEHRPARGHARLPLARRLHVGGSRRASAAAGTPTTRRPRAAASPAPAPSTTSPGRRRSRITTPGSSASPRRVTARRR